MDERPKAKNRLALSWMSWIPFRFFRNSQNPAIPMASEEVGGPGLSPLPRLDDLGRGHALWKGQIGLHHQGPSQHDDEEDSQTPPR